MPEQPPDNRRTSQALQLALQHHQARRLPEAEACYRQILLAEPQHPDALHLLGVIAQQAGQYEVAIQLIRAAMEHHPRSADYPFNLGNTFLLQGNLPDAAASYRRSIALDATHVDALHSLANVLAEQNEYAESEKFFLRALEVQPNHAEAHYNLGNLKRKRGDLSSAIVCYRQALQLRPDCAGFHYNLAHTLHQSGELKEAAAEYRQVLRLTPGDAEAHYNLGIVLQEQGAFAPAGEALRSALLLRPDYAEALSNLGAVLQLQDDFAAAAEAFHRAITLKPELAQAHSNLGGNLWRQGDLAGALASCRRAIALKPELAEAHSHLGHVLADQGDLDGALECYHRAIALQPEFAEAHSLLGHALSDRGELHAARLSYLRAVELQPELAEAHSNLAGILWRLGDLPGALQSCRRAIALKPELAEAHNHLGHVLSEQGDLPAALESYQRAVALKPEFAEAHNSLGGILWRQGDLAGALESCHRALALKPGLAEAHSHVGHVLAHQGDLAAALESYQRASTLKPAAGEFLYYAGLAHLLRGEFRVGWKNYEYRWNTRALRKVRREFAQSESPSAESVPTEFASAEVKAKLWRGEPLNGARILLHSEQGLGDTLQFVRYVPLVAARGGEVLLEVQPELQRLLARTEGATHVLARGDALPNFSWHCPLLSLPLAFATELATIPHAVPYLRANPQETQNWSQRLANDDDEKLRVALAWAGNPKHVRDAQRSVKLSQLAPLAHIDARFYSLQKGPAAAQQIAAGMKLIDLAGELTDFADTAALLSNLDLLITVDTAVAHLAGALGKPVWLLLTQAPDWRWLLHRADSPWYPSMRLFRQPAAGDWAAVLGRVAAELALLVNGASPTSHRELRAQFLASLGGSKSHSAGTL
jgi:tetratricopeptide (TPR) repeat protein